MADKSKISSDNFISKIVKDPKQVPETIMLTGYLGQSSEDKYTRLYFDVQLSSYVEIPDDGILHTQDLPADSSPLGGSYVWIKKDAELIHGKTSTQRVKAKFLEGPIVSNYMQAATGLQQGSVTNDSFWYCQETFQDIACSTTKHGWACTIVQQPTEQAQCPTNYPRYCQPITPHCPTPHCPTHNAPFVCFPTKICQIFEGNPAAKAEALAQPAGLPTVPPQLCNPTHISPVCGFTHQPLACHTHFPIVCPPTQYAPLCPPTSNHHLCLTVVAFCDYTVAGAVCPTHTPACVPTLTKQVCATHTPGCVTQIPVNCPITLPAACPLPTGQNCPSFGPCPSLACGFGNNPGYY